jgi:type II secretory pathway component PulF
MNNKKQKLQQKDLAPKKLGFFDKFFLGEEKNYIVENLTLLADSGMGMLSALNAISDGSQSKRVKKIVNGIKYDIDSGCTLGKALENTKIFSEKAISLIKIGEKSGQLTNNLKVVSEQQQKERVFNSKIRGALMYPVFILVVASSLSIGIAWFILPKLATVFSELRVEMPLITKIFIALGVFLGKYGTIFVPSLIFAILFLIYILFFLKQTKGVGSFLLFNMPIFKKIILQIEISRFGYLLGSLLDAGMPITESIRSIKETADFSAYKKFYAYLEQNIEEGNSFAKTFSSYKKINKLIPSPIQQMIITSEQSGHLSQTLKKIGSVYEEKLDNTTKNLAVILEPVMLVIVWLAVVAVALAVILPIYSLIGGLKK